MNFQNQIEYGNLNGLDVLSGVPEISPLNRDTLKSHIVFRCGLLIPLYSEPETMQAAISHWFNYMAYDISKMLELAQTEYLPLENYRRTESETRDQWITNDKTNTGTDTLAHTGTDTMAHTGTIGDSGGETTTDTGTITDEYTSNNEHTVSAYNESTYSPDNKDDGGGDNERTLDTEREVTRGNTRTFLNNDTRTRADTDTRTLNLADNGVEHNADKVDRLVYGNIGTMTAQDMFNQELDLLDRFNPYDWIVDRFETDLFLGIW